MFADLKVSTRLAAAFGTIVVLLVVAIALGVSRRAVLNEHLHSITDENDEEASLASELQTIAYDIGVSVRDIIIITDAEKLRARHEELLADYQRMDDTVEKLNKMFTEIASTTANEKELLAKIRTSMVVAKASANRTADLGMSNKNEEATAILKAEFMPQNAEVRALCLQLVQFEQKLNNEAVAAATATYQSGRSTLLLLGALAG